MRTCAVLFVSLLTVAFAGADDKDAKPLSPDEAVKHVKEKCTVEMEVKSAGGSKKQMMIFLNSEANYRDGKNFTIVIDKSAAEKFKKEKIDDPAVHFKGKTIRVTGTITLHQNHPQIQVEGPEQITVVEKKK